MRPSPSPSSGRSGPRAAAAVVLALVALGLSGLLVSAQYGLATEYGAGTGTSLVVLAALPVLAAALAARAAGSGRRVLLGLVSFVVLTLVAVPAAGALGERVRQDRFAAVDAAFACDDGAPEEVDAAFAALPHPAPYWLYGPLSAGPSGCTAGIDGPVEEAFAAWRGALIGSGWAVEQDAAEVVVERAGVRVTLLRDAGTAMLNVATTDAGPCDDGRTASLGDGQVAAC